MMDQYSTTKLPRVSRSPGKRLYSSFHKLKPIHLHNKKEASTTKYLIEPSACVPIVTTTPRDSSEMIMGRP